MSPKGTSVALVAALLSASPVAIASPQDLFGFGPRTMALGGTGASFADDYSAVHTNPAAVSRARSTAFSLGYMGAAFDVTLQPRGEASQHFGLDRARATLIGLTLPLPFGGILRDRLAIGLGFYTPIDVVARGRILSYETPQSALLADRTQTVALQLGLGADIGRGFRLGVGFGALAAIVGNVLVATDASGRAGSRVDTQLVAAYAPMVGASWERGPFRVAAVFRGALVGNFLVDIATRDIGINLPLLHISGLAQFDPMQVAAETSLVHAGWTVAIGATLKFWCGYPGVRQATTDMSPQPPPTQCPADGAPRPANAFYFSNTVVPRLGVERRWDIGRSYIAVRLGYFYEPSPTPEPRPDAMILDNDRHAITAGIGVAGRIGRTLLGVDFFSQVHILANRSTAGQALSFGGNVTVFGTTGTVTF